VSKLESLRREELIAIILGLKERVEVLEAENEQLRSMLSGGGNASSTVAFVKTNRKERR
jgi:hypothetical protein